MDRNLRSGIADQVSAGGVIYRQTDSGTEVALILTNPERRWQLPKGMIDEGENAAEAALRETREETGLVGELISEIESTEYWFSASYDGQRKRYHKTVHWFLFSYLSGAVDDHDDEVIEARFETIESALELLTFGNERDILRKAAEMIGKRPQKHPSMERAS